MDSSSIHSTIQASAGNPEPITNPQVNLDEIKELALHALEDAKAKWEVVSREADAYIRENPGKAVLAALGAGILIGLLIKD